MRHLPGTERPAANDPCDLSPAADGGFAFVPHQERTPLASGFHVHVGSAGGTGWGGGRGGRRDGCGCGYLQHRAERRVTATYIQTRAKTACVPRDVVYTIYSHGFEPQMTPRRARLVARLSDAGKPPPTPPKKVSIVRHESFPLDHRQKHTIVDDSEVTVHITHRPMI